MDSSSICGGVVGTAAACVVDFDCDALVLLSAIFFPNRLPAASAVLYSDFFETLLSGCVVDFL